MNKLNHKPFIVFTVLLFLLTLWRVIANYIIDPDSQLFLLTLWGSFYQFIAFFGGIFGFFVSKKWGGLKSYFGKSVFFFSLGLLLQSFGQIVYSYYVLKGLEVVYPSIGDAGFFGSVFMYIVGACYLARVVSLKGSFSKIHGKVIACGLGGILLATSYYLFLKDYPFEGFSIKLFLDFAYPLGQALYVGVAIYILLNAKFFSQGRLFKSMLVLLFALIFQFFSDYSFLYLSLHELWEPFGLNDVLYMLSYWFMAISLTSLNSTFNNLKN